MRDGEVKARRRARLPGARVCAGVAVIVGLTTVASARRQDVPHPLAKALVGSWSGTLEYQDYSSDRRVTLATKLVVASGGGSVVTFDYTYDEGNGRFATSSQRVTIVSTPPTYRVQSADGQNDTTFAADGLATIGDNGGTVVLTGRGRENDQDVDLRTTITVTPSALTMQRDSRRAGDEWRLRNRYSLRR